MKEFLLFLAAVAEPLYELFVHIRAGSNDPDAERELALNVVRAAKDAQARAEIQP